MMLSDITYRIYSIRDLREWLINNKNNGITTYCISPMRAYALINNPCAQDNDPALVITFDKSRPVGYSAVFADGYLDGLTRGRYFWGTTEWIDLEYRGTGIAGNMMRTLKEAVGIERYIGLDSSIASVKLDQKQGANVICYDRCRYQLISKHSLKGRMFSEYIRINNQRQLKGLEKYEYRNQYVYFIDEQTYLFIKSHADHDLFLRQREMFNWILSYPFKISTHNDTRSINDICEFDGTQSEYAIETVKVYVHDKLVGFYMVSQTNYERSLRFLYYDHTYKNEVFASVTQNLLKPGVETIRFISFEIHEFMRNHGIKHLNRKSYIDKVALTLPPNMTVDSSMHLQGGDGDMFC